MEESSRQALGAIFIALATAAGPDALQEACKTIALAIDSGAVCDPGARTILQTLVRSCESPTKPASDLLDLVEAKLNQIDADTPIEDIVGIFDLVSQLELAIDQLALAVDVTSINTVAA